MVVLVSRHDVEDHPPELLLDGGHRQFQLTDRQQCLLVGIGTGLVEIEMCQRAERLHVQLRPGCQPIKAPRHEMPPPVFF